MATSTLDFKLAIINAIKTQRRDPLQDGDYEDGFADALAQCVEDIEKIPLPDTLSPRDAYSTPKPL